MLTGYVNGSRMMKIFSYSFLDDFQISYNGQYVSCLEINGNNQKNFHLFIIQDEFALSIMLTAKEGNLYFIKLFCFYQKNKFSVLSIFIYILAYNFKDKEWCVTIYGDVLEQLPINSRQVVHDVAKNICQVTVNFHGTTKIVLKLIKSTNHPVELLALYSSFVFISKT